MEEPELLMIPGPVTVDDEVLEALAQPVRAHYGDEWVALYGHVTAGMRDVFRTESDVHLVFGSGMAGVEVCIASVLSPGDEILVPSNGSFGDRLAEVSKANGLVVHEPRPGPLEPITGESVERALREHPNSRAVAIVHSETSIGILNEVREVAAAARGRGVLTIVDGISSVGGVPLEMDAWGVDLCVTVANKCLGGPIGVAPVAAGPRAVAAVQDGRPKCAGWYLNLATMWRYAERWRTWHPHATTMPTSIIAAFDVAVSRALDEGLPNLQARLVAARDRVRGGLRELGFEMLVADAVASPTVTAVRALDGMDVRDYLDWLLREHRLRVGGGLGEYAGRIFRVGHMGRAAEPAATDRFLAATAEYVELRRLGAAAARRGVAG